MMFSSLLMIACLTQIQQLSSSSANIETSAGRVFFQSVAENKEVYIDKLRLHLDKTGFSREDDAISRCELDLLTESSSDASRNISSVLAEWPDSESVANLAIRAYLRNGEFESAKQLCDQTIRKHPESLDTKLLASLVDRKVNEETILLADRDPIVLLIAAQIYASKKEYNRSLELANKFLSIRDKGPLLMEDVPHYLRGVSLFYLNLDLREATLALERAIELNTNQKRADVFELISRSYLIQKDYALALAWAEKAYAASPDDYNVNLLIVKSLLGSQRGELDTISRKRAIVSLRKAIKQQPNEHDLTCLLVLCLFEEGDTTAAIDELRPVYKQFGLRGSVLLTRFLIASKSQSKNDIELIERTLNDAVANFQTLEYATQSSVVECLINMGDVKSAKVLLNSCKHPDAQDKNRLQKVIESFERASTQN